MRYQFPVIIPIAILKIVRWFTLQYYKLRSPFLAWIWGVNHGSRVLFQGKIIIRTRGRGNIVLGKNVKFNSDHRVNLVGLINPVILDTCFGGRIEVGDSSGASSVVMSSMSLITIGKRCKIGGNVRIFDHDFHSVDAKLRCTSEDRLHIKTSPVIIEDDCFIGTNAIILKGTHIGTRSIVAAGSVVFGLQIPPDSLIKGNPAQIVSHRTH